MKTKIREWFMQEQKRVLQNMSDTGGDLSSGFLDKRENIICPVHNYRFNLNNGCDTNAEGYFLKIFEAKEDVEEVFVKMP